MADMTRSLAMTEARERTFKANVSSVDATIRGLKEQVQRMRNTVQQVRAQCANDVRKRDLEMQKLRSYLAERQRGKRDGMGVTTINISSTVDRESKSKSMTGGEGVNDPGYSLRQETTEFLTELCQNLSDENDELITIARNSIQTLKDLQGMPCEEETGQTNAAMSVGSQQFSQSPVQALPTSCEELNLQMNMVLDELRTLLTNPSFVPLEEVELRDEEIKRLRGSWEKMENKWKQALWMMDGWNKRLSDGGDLMRIDELQMGLSSDCSIDSENRTRESVEDGTSSVPMQGPEQDEASKEAEIGQVHSSALQERSDNSRLTKSPRKVAFPTGIKSPLHKSGNKEDETLPVKAHESDCVTQRPLKKAKHMSTDSSQVGATENGTK